MQRIRLPITAMTALLLVTACGAPQQRRFEPTERLTARSPDGYLAAEYDLDTRDRQVGEARVWSDGAFRKEIRGRMHTVAHVAFQIENHTDEPMRLSTDDLALTSGMLDQHVIEDIAPASVEGPTTIQPQALQRIDVYFALPEGINPRDVDAFTVRWRLQNGDLTYTQHTPFMASRTERVGRYYYTPFYDPFFYNPYIYHPRIVVHRYPYRHVFR